MREGLAERRLTENNQQKGITMFEHFSSADELFRFRLASALTMERDSLEMLGELEGAAHDDELKSMFRHHAEETRQQLDNLEEIFRLIGEEPNGAPSPTTKGLAKEGQSLIRKSDPAVVDDVVISAALGTEHYEISTYQTLIAAADALGAEDVQRLLKQNLDQEVHTSEELAATGKKFAMATAGNR